MISCSSDNSPVTPVTSDPARSEQTQEQAQRLLNQQKCVDCEAETMVEYFQSADLEDFAQNHSAGYSMEALAGEELRNEEVDWTSPDPFVRFFHLQNLHDKVLQLCKPVEIPSELRQLYEDLPLATQLDLLQQVYNDMRSTLNFVVLREPELIDQAIALAEDLNQMRISSAEFTSAIEELKQSYPRAYESYDQGISDHQFVLSAFHSFEQQLGGSVNLPSEGRLAWMGHLEFIREQVLEEGRPLDPGQIEHIQAHRGRNQWDNLQFKASQTVSLVKFLFPLPGEPNSVYQQILENLKVNLKAEQQCFSQSCLESINRVQKELSTCLNQ
jgi:hypothetical protein